jgi:hypothetical protein
MWRLQRKCQPCPQQGQQPPLLRFLVLPRACCPSQVDTLDEAIELINANKHGNGTAVFTASGAAARRFQHDIDVGMVGVGGTWSAFLALA